jgi:hypothetical protein
VVAVPLVNDVLEKQRINFVACGLCRVLKYEVQDSENQDECLL